MINPNSLRRATPAVLTLALGGVLLSGCGRSASESTEQCYPGVVRHSVSESVLEVLGQNGHKLDDMLNLNEASSAINTILVDLHQEAQHKYNTVLPDDTFGVCVTDNNVTAAPNIQNPAYTYSVIDQ